MKLFRPLLSILMLSTLTLSYAQNWVKVAIPESGVYSISYDDLRKMGFSDPAKVYMAGRGAAVLPSSANYEADYLSAVPVYREGENLFFYGVGPENFSFTVNRSFNTYGKFTNSGRNVNSDYGYYYLTDDEALAAEITVVEKPAGATPEITQATSFYVFEEDLFHNNTNSGNLYWGERFNSLGNPNKSWNINLPLAANDKGLLQAVIYSERNEEANVTIGTGATGGTRTFSGIKSTASYLSPLSNVEAEVPVTKGANTVKVNYSSSSNLRGVANLDYWILTYNLDLNSLGNADNQILSFPTMVTGSSGYLSVDGTKRRLLDVSKPSEPKMVYFEEFNGQTAFAVHASKSAPFFVLFDESKAQKQVKSWEKVDNPKAGSLRQLAANGADMVIISTAPFMSYAEEVADIHRKNEGMNVIVVELGKIYEEFSEGLPDPEAYRRFMSLFVNNANPVRNLLLVGEITADPRKHESLKGYAMAHIIPQQSSVHYERGAYPILDYYACPSTTPDAEEMEKAELEYGIGFLPFDNEQDAKTYLDKINRYLNDSPHSFAVNEWLMVGGTGDNHTHDQQCVSLNANIQQYSAGSVIGSVLALDAYGNEPAKAKLMEYLDKGKNVMIYFGHSSQSMFGKDNLFFTTSDLYNLSNNTLPFLLTAGCSTTNTDNGFRGMGEEWVIGPKGGAIASFATLRETWSSQNYDIVTKFCQVLTALPTDDNELSFGEIYQLTKNKATNANDLCFILIGDPALKLPTPSNNIDMTISGSIIPGDKVEVSGDLLDAKGKTASSLSGTLILKLTAPAETLVSEDVITGGNDNVLEVTYADRILAVASAEIKNGRFTAQFPVPAAANAFIRSNCKIYASYCDPATMKGYNGVAEAPVREGTSAGSIASDKSAPVISDISFDPASNAIYVAVSDNEGLALSKGIEGSSPVITLDGKISNKISLLPLQIENSGKEAILMAYLPEMSNGMHSANVTVSDLNGNKASKSSQFNAGLIPDIDLTLNELAVNNQATFTVNGLQGNASLVIITADGAEVRTIPVNGSNVTWDGKDNNGIRVAAGLYRAVVRGSGNAASSFSPVIHVPVI